MSLFQLEFLMFRAFPWECLRVTQEVIVSQPHVDMVSRGPFSIGARPLLFVSFFVVEDDGCCSSPV